MAAPTLSSTSPTTLVAGAAPVTVTLTGTNFATGIVITSATPGITVTSSAYVSATSATCKMAAAPGNTRSRISVTLTNTDLGTVTDTTHGPSVVAPALATGGGDAVAYPVNTIPGATPGTTGDAVASKMATTHQAINPAYDPANEGVGAAPGGVQGSSAGNPGIVTPPGGDDTGDLEQDAIEMDTESVPMGDHSVQLPLAPTSVTATTGTIVNHATVSWLAPVDPDGYAITGYTVTATSSDGGAASSLTVGNVLTGSVAGLTSNKHYTFTVAAINARGTGASSAASSSLLITTVPNAPVIGAATVASSTSVSVAFTASTDTGGSTITGYTATSTPGGLTHSGASSPLVVTGLTTGTPYTFTVHATNAIGNSVESAASNAATPA